MGSVFIQLLLEFYHIHFIKNLKPNNFEQTNKKKAVILKKLKKHYVLQRYSTAPVVFHRPTEAGGA